MLDRRDRATWGGRGLERGGLETCVFLQRMEKRLLCVSHYFFFLFYVYMSFDSQSLKGRREGYFG